MLYLNFFRKLKFELQVIRIMGLNDSKNDKHDCESILSSHPWPGTEIQISCARNTSTHLRVVTEPPKLQGPHALIIVITTSDHYARVPNNLESAINLPNRISLTSHCSITTFYSKYNRVNSGRIT